MLVLETADWKCGGVLHSMLAVPISYSDHRATRAQLAQLAQLA